MKTLIIYFQLNEDKNNVVHKIYYGYTNMINENDIKFAIMKHADGRDIRKAWW